MYNISESEIDFIINDIEERGVELTDLQNNLLDHICCIIENEMPADDDFYKFYESTISRFYKKELVELEEETKNLLIFKNFYAMKRTMKIVGILSTILVVLGAVFKLFHLPGASIGIVFGIALFGLVFMPLLIALKYRDEGLKKDKVVFSIGFFIGIIGVFGILFKIQHWPAASLLIEISLALFVLVFTPMYFVNGYRQADKRFNTMITSFLILVGASMMLVLTNTGMLNGVKESLYSVDSYLNTYNKNITEVNSSLMASFKGKSEGCELVHLTSKELYLEIETIKQWLISKTEEVTVEKAANLSLRDFQNLGNSEFVYGFIYGRLDFSYEDLKASVDLYNLKLKGKVYHPVEMINKELYATTLPIYLHQLSQLQQQIVNNESNYLNFYKGKQIVGIE